MGKQHTVLMNLGTASVQKEHGLEVREIADNHFGGTMAHALRYIIADWLKHNRRAGHMNVDTGKLGALQTFLDEGVDEDRLIPINIADATQQQL